MDNCIHVSTHGGMFPYRNAPRASHVGPLPSSTAPSLPALYFSCAFQAFPFRGIIDVKDRVVLGFSFTFFVLPVHYTIPPSIFAFCFTQGFIPPKSERAKSHIVL